MYRKVNMRFPRDSKIRSLSKDGHHLALAIIVSPMSHGCGCYYYPTPMMADETGMSITEVEAALGQLVCVKFCEYDDVACVIWVPKMAKYQFGAWNKNNLINFREHLDSIEGDLPKKAWAYLEAYAIPSITPSPPSCQSQDQDQDQDQDKPQCRLKPTSSSRVSAGKEDPRTVEQLLERYAQNKPLIERALADCAKTRQDGKMSVKKIQRFLVWADAKPVDQVVAGCDVYCASAYGEQGRDERYLAGIIRGGAKTNKHTSDWKPPNRKSPPKGVPHTAWDSDKGKFRTARDAYWGNYPVMRLIDFATGRTPMTSEEDRIALENAKTACQSWFTENA